MSSQPATRVAVSRASGGQRRSGSYSGARRDADAFLVTVLTIAATIVALYDLLLLGGNIR